MSSWREAVSHVWLLMLYNIHEQSGHGRGRQTAPRAGHDEAGWYSTLSATTAESHGESGGEDITKDKAETGMFVASQADGHGEPY